jgi:hypothetical protein
VFQFFPIPELTRTLLTSLVGVLTLVGIMTRPFRWNEAVIAMVGAGVLLLLGLITPGDAFYTLVRDWNTFLFFLGMMALSTLAEAAGLFDWLAAQAARFAGKSARTAFSKRFSARDPHLSHTLQRRDCPYIDANRVRPGDEAPIACSALPVCLHLYRRYRFFPAAGQQPN